MTTGQRRNELLGGAFVLISAAAFAVFAFRVGGVDLRAPFKPRAVRCLTYFDDVKTLDEGARVAVAGREVGVVRTIQVVDRPLSTTEVDRLLATYGPDAFPGLRAGYRRHTVEVHFELTTPSLRIDLDTAAVQLGQDGLLGRHFLTLDPGYWSDDQRPQTLGERTFDAPLEFVSQESRGIDALVSALIPVANRAEALLEGLRADVLNEANGQRIGQVLEELAASLSALRAQLDADDPQSLQQRVVDPLHSLLTNADETITELRERVLEQTLTDVETLLHDGSEAIAHADAALVEVQHLVETSRPELEAMVGDLRDTTAHLDARLAEIERSATTLLDDADRLLVSNEAELAETLRRLRRTMWQAELAVRKIRANPAVLLYGDDDPDLEARPLDRTPLWRRGRAAPYEQRQER